MSEVEKSDVVVVGARLAGCALAAPLARAGRKVVVLDRMSFPSDQLSTHVLFSNGVAELASLGALPRILALDPTNYRAMNSQANPRPIFIDRSRSVRSSFTGAASPPMLPRPRRNAETIVGIERPRAMKPPVATAPAPM